MKKIISLFLALIAISLMTISCSSSDSTDPIDPVDPVEVIKKILIIYDDDSTNVSTDSLKTALETANFEVTFSTVNESAWDNTNPSLTGFHGVIHLNGTTYNNVMPIEGQNALVDFVQNKAGYYVQAEWDGYQISRNEMLAMRDIVLLDRGTGNNGDLTFTTVTDQSSHAVLKNIPASFVATAEANGTAHIFDEEPSVVLMTEDTKDAVVVREFGTGKVLGFHHSGNYNGKNTWSDTNVQTIIINFFEW